MKNSTKIKGKEIYINTGIYIANECTNNIDNHNIIHQIGNSILPKLFFHFIEERYQAIKSFPLICFIHFGGNAAENAITIFNNYRVFIHSCQAKGELLFILYIF